ncbi:MAG: hypothetical protein ACP5GU_05745 [Thermoprotei archaeon]|jgi:hypothetical protein
MTDFWSYLGILSVVALLGFIMVSLLFIISPNAFTGAGINIGSALWYSLSIAFMSTVSIIALMIFLNPKRYWAMLLPLAIGKLTSSALSLYWYNLLGGSVVLLNVIDALQFNFLMDGLIGVIALILYMMAYRISSKHNVL